MADDPLYECPACGGIWERQEVVKVLDLMAAVVKREPVEFLGCPTCLVAVFALPPDPENVDPGDSPGAEGWRKSVNPPDLASDNSVDKSE